MKKLKNYLNTCLKEDVYFFKKNIKVIILYNV